MARYFKYKSSDELAADAKGLGSSLSLSQVFAPLFEPCRIGSLTLGNRLCVQPMEGCDGTLDGGPDELTYRRYRRFGAGGAKRNVRDGQCACVGLGRATLSHPDFAKHLQEHGSMNRKLTCRTFSYCTNLMRVKNHRLVQYATGCPPFDKEIYGPLWKEVEAKRANQ
jgi:hypothetical protein